MENSNTLHKMKAQVSVIRCPKEWESVDDYSSHRPLLYLAINKVPHESMYEYGMGEGSTPLLRIWYNEMNNIGKEFYSYENNKDWAEKYITDNYKLSPYGHGNFIFKSHCIKIVEDYLYWDCIGKYILFVDSAPGEQRKEIIAKHANKAEVIIVHDSEKSSQFCYDLEPTLSLFKYRLDYEPKWSPHTTCISNFINISEWA